MILAFHITLIHRHFIFINTVHLLPREQSDICIRCQFVSRREKFNIIIIQVLNAILNILYFFCFSTQNVKIDSLNKYLKRSESLLKTNTFSIPSGSFKF